MDPHEHRGRALLARVLRHGRVLEDVVAARVLRAGCADTASGRPRRMVDRPLVRRARDVPADGAGIRIEDAGARRGSRRAR